MLSNVTPGDVEDGLEMMNENLDNGNDDVEEVVADEVKDKMAMRVMLKWSLIGRKK